MEVLEQEALRAEKVGHRHHPPGRIRRRYQTRGRSRRSRSSRQVEGASRRLDLVEEEDVVVEGLAAVALAVVVDGEDVEVEEALAVAVAADSDGSGGGGRKGRRDYYVRSLWRRERESEGSVRERESNNTCWCCGVRERRGERGRWFVCVCVGDLRVVGRVVPVA